jgi:hypothetical protein
MRLLPHLFLGAVVFFVAPAILRAQAPETPAPPSDVTPPPSDAPPSDVVPPSDAPPPSDVAPVETAPPVDPSTEAAPPTETAPAPAELAAPQDVAVDGEQVETGSATGEETASAIDAPGPAAARPSADRIQGQDSEALEEEEESTAPWRGSVVEYRNALGLYSHDPSGDLTYNPYYVMALSFRPRWYFGDTLNVSARLDIAHELTTADTGIATVVLDPYVSVGARQLYTIPGVEIHISPDLRVIFPTSPLSRFRTLVLGIAPGIAFTREFDLGDGGDLTLGYRPRFTFNFHRSTTRELGGARFEQCSVDRTACLNDGTRNAPYRLTNGFDATYAPLEWLGVSVLYAHITDWLYSMSTDKPRDAFDNPIEEFNATENSNVRFYSIFSFEVSVTPVEMLEIGVGLETLNPQLAPDSRYHNPIYNRFTQFYVDLRLQIAPLVEAIQEL